MKQEGNDSEGRKADGGAGSPLQAMMGCRENVRRLFHFDVDSAEQGEASGSLLDLGSQRLRLRLVAEPSKCDHQYKENHVGGQELTA